MKAVLHEVLKSITPSGEEKKSEAALAKKIMEQIKSLEGKHIGVAWAGSSARDTHLKGDRDLDIFVLFPKQLSRKEFEKEGLRIGKLVFKGHKWEEAYSEHPYIRGTMHGFQVEIVPSYKVKDASKKQSSVDRSVFHQRYLKKRLSEKHKAEIRLLRQFLKGIGCYGAEIKTSSVPGYVVELLILKYKTFAKAINAIAAWKQGQVIDLEKHYPQKEARKKFNWHLVVVDPVDKNRNVSAALSLEQFNRLASNANDFLEKPSIKFFFPEKTKPLPAQKLTELLAKKELVGFEIDYPKKTLADIAWGQIRRLKHKVAKQLELKDFKVKKALEWTDEKHSIVFLFELESKALEKKFKRIGPPVELAEHSEKFLEKHAKAKARVENGRWIVEADRKFTSAQKFLLKYLEKIAEEEKENIRKAIKQRTTILDEKNILKLYRQNNEFAEFLTKCLKGKEKFF